MAPNVEDFESFYDLHPEYDVQCIYFIPAGPRCSTLLELDAHLSAKQLREHIISKRSLEKLPEYIKRLCCECHQDRLVADRLLRPLSERWEDEIQRYVPNANPTTIAPHVSSELRQTSSPIVPASHNTTSNGGASTSNDVPQRPQTPPPQVLHPVSANLALDLAPAAQIPNGHSPTRSKFRPYKPNPDAKDNIARQLRGSLRGSADKPGDSDFTPGWVYIFERESSPGHVKIGWTAGSVDSRLQDWKKKCGYAPIPVAQFGGVPFARRVETLTHYELIQHWRFERCEKCNTLHREWFEVDKKKATTVLGGWAALFANYEPYSTKGALREGWMKAVKDLETKKMQITVQNLKDAYHRTWTKISAEEVRSP
jgi:hypothetical protein